MKPRIRSSGLSCRLECPGSARLAERQAADVIDFGEEQLGDGDDNMTWRGNWIHYQVGRLLAPDAELPPPELPKSYVPSKWDHASVEWHVSQVLARTPGHHAIRVEEYFEHEFERFVLTGHIDCYSLDPELTEFAVNDHKTGQHAVDEAGENWQLAAYALLLWKRYPTLKTGKLRILQRAADWAVSEVDIAEGDLPKIESFLVDAIGQSIDRPTLLRTGKGCRLCNAYSICPALRKEIMELEQSLVEFEKIATTASTADLAVIAARFQAIRTPGGKLLDMLKDRLVMEGGSLSLPGVTVTLKDRPGMRTVKAPHVAHQRLASVLGEEAAWACTSFSVSDAEEALVSSGMPRKSRDPEKSTADKWVAENFADITERKTSKVLQFK